MHVLSYISNSTSNLNIIQSDIENIVEVAHKRNLECGITGVLFYANSYFFQTLEGEESDLRMLYASIKNDPRHEQINILVDEPLEERQFSGWMMDTYYVDTPELINPDTIEILQSLYVQNYAIEMFDIVNFTKKMVGDLNTFRISGTPYSS